MLSLRRVEIADGYCGNCRKQVVVQRPKINHLPYFLGTVMTGFCAIFWIRDAYRQYPWKCAECHSNVYKIMENIYK